MTSADQATKHLVHAAASPRYAVVFKTYSWDAFIARQLERYDAIIETGDLFVSVDETNGNVGPIPHDRVVRTRNDELIALGLANRFEKGSLIWWNADYPHYQFFKAHPDYDYYVFVEYDTCVTIDIDTLIDQVATTRADLVAHPRLPTRTWYWTRFHAATYDIERINGSLNCITILSNRAMRVLMQRRLDMSRQADIPFWPISEVFIATEIVNAGYKFLPLSEFGDVAHYDSFPPLLEEELSSLHPAGFAHPVLNRSRYIHSHLHYGYRLVDYLLPHSLLHRSLARVSGPVPRSQIAVAFWRRCIEVVRQRFGAP